jgi:hypothetical protein
VLSRYAAALEARDIAQLKKVWPGLAGAQEVAIANEFRIARTISVSLSDPNVQVEGSTAVATCRRTHQLETTDGQRLQTNTQMVFTMRRSPSGWVIERVRFEAER